MVVLDASALLIYVRGDAGAEEIANQLEAGGAAISLVSFLEVLHQLEGVSVARLSGICDRVGIRVYDFMARHLNVAVGSLRNGVSLERAVSESLARALNVQVVASLVQVPAALPTKSSPRPPVGVIEAVGGGDHASQNA